MQPNQNSRPEAEADLQQAALQSALAAWAGQPGPLLPILHQLQQQLGHIPESLLPQIGVALNLSRAEVHGVVSYYHHFRTAPPARHSIQLCRAESCQAMGADALAAHVMARTGCGGDDLHPCHSADGRYSVEPVYCLGLCAASPALQIGDQLHARMTADKFDALLRQLEQQA